MAFSFTPGGNRPPMADINMVPLIDVMLVLLVVFIVAAPLLTHAVRVDLPHAASSPVPASPEAIELTLRADGSLFWDGAPIPPGALEARMKAAGERQPAPEIHLRADAATPYNTLARVMALAARCGLSRIGFVSDPAPKPQ